MMASCNDYCLSQSTTNNWRYLCLASFIAYISAVETLMSEQLLLTSHGALGHDQEIKKGMDETDQTYKMFSPSCPSDQGNITPRKGTEKKKFQLSLGLELC